MYYSYFFTIIRRIRGIRGYYEKASCGIGYSSLFESGLDRFCGIIVVVSTERKLQLERLLARDSRFSEDDARDELLVNGILKTKEID